MLAKDRWLLPEGIEEIFPSEARRLEDLRRRVLDTFERWGYELVIPPLIEYLDSLLVGAGHDLDLQTFKLIDQISGRLMGIRADMTPQVARIDVRMSDRDLPTRLCYEGSVLHTQADHLERSRSPLQVGAELYGHSGIESDVEIIRLALETIAIAGVSNVHLDLGHVEIYRGLIRQCDLDQSKEAILFEILQRKDRGELMLFLEQAKLSEAVSRILPILLELNGNEKVIEIARERLKESGDFARQPLDDLEAVYRKLRISFPLLPIHFDLAELRGYHYQTGVVFAAFVQGYGREIARGGRYDEIGKVFGRSRPATGFSADLKVLMRLGLGDGLAERDSAVFAPALDDPELYSAVRKLRGEGYRVIQELPGQKGTAVEMMCDFELRKVNGTWLAQSVGDCS